MEQEQQQQLSEEEIVYRALNSVEGAALLNLLKAKFVDRLSYNTKEVQPYSTFFREGERNVVGWMITTVLEFEETEEVAVKKNL